MKFKQRCFNDRKIWAQSDALRCGIGWDEDDLEKPLILVEDVFGESHPGSTHLDKLAKNVNDGIYIAGGKPANFHVTDVCDGWAQGHDGMNYILASREIIADMVEIHASASKWDGLVLISSCDKAIPAHLRVAARLDLPTIFIPGGSMRPGPYMSDSGKGGEISLREKQHNITQKEVMNYKLTGCPTCGACQFMGTASTMQCMAEALGLALPGTALSPATGNDILRTSKAAGKQILELVDKNITSRKILTPAAFKNAIIVHAAIGGSTNALLHFPAIAQEMGFDLDLTLFDEMNKIIPHICNITPSGQYPTELLWSAGGIPMVQWILKDYLDLSVLTVTGKTLGENLEALNSSGYFDRILGYLYNYGLKREDIIHSIENTNVYGSVAVLKGNIAPEGAVIKYSAVAPEMLYHVGKAKVFNSEEACNEAVVNNKVEPGSILFIRYEGPRGSGMPEMLMTTESIMNNEALKSSTVLVTDGRFSGATKGPCIGHVSPEAASGGPIALVEDNDIVELDVINRKINVIGINGNKCSPAEVEAIFAERKKYWKAPDFSNRKGVFKRYTALATSAMQGAFIKV